MQLVESLSMDFETVDDFREALISNHLYNSPAAYDLLSKGMECGRVRGTEQMTNNKELSSMLSVSFEAHFRVELWYALSTQGFRHSYTSEASIERARLFKEVLPYVLADRRNNGEDAWKKRCDDLIFDGTFMGAEDNEADTQEHGGIEFEEDQY